MSQAIKKELILKGLHCANCAVKIEKEIGKLDGLSSANIDFATGKLIINHNETIDWENTLENAKKIINNIENGITIIEKDTEINKERETHKPGLFQLINKKLIFKIVFSILFLLIATVYKINPTVNLLLYIISYLIIGSEVLVTAFKNILRGRIFDENFLMGIATIGALLIKEYPEAVSVMLFYQIGELFQEMAVSNSRKSIENLLKIRPDFANLKVNENISQVSPENVNIGDIIIVKPGERIPLDGRVLGGTSALDTSALTGESIPKLVQKDSEVLSGCINMSGLLTIEVTKVFSESTVSKILDMVENASSKKAPTEKFITKFASYYTPFVVFIALALAIVPQLIIGTYTSVWIYRALLFLVISCPCALVISIPLGFFGGIGAASKKGILIKGSNYLEALNNLEIVAFDKTGTLTKGSFEINNISPSRGFSSDNLLEWAAYVEYYSNHPIALSIVDHYEGAIDKSLIMNFKEVPGYGVKALIKGKAVVAGNLKLMEQEGVIINTNNDGHLLKDSLVNPDTTVYIAVENEYIGKISFSDTIKEDSAKAIEFLKNMGVKKTILLTGDNKNIALDIGKKLGIEQVHYELLPQHKVEVLEQLFEEKTEKGKIAFVGDGINDAPVLARADIGIAMGGLGSDAAMEAADIILMTDEPSKLIQALRISQKTRTIVMQNIVLALGVKAIVLLLGAIGIATMWEAVFADVGVALLAVLNSMRVLKN